jgi:hypothetical protein
MDDVSGALRSVKLRLLKCTPFRGLPDDKVKDIRKKVPNPRAREKDCPERTLLLNSLAGALLAWETAQASAPYVDSLNADLDQLAAMLEHCVSVWEELPQLGIRFGGQASIHRSTLQMARDLMQQWRQHPLAYDAHASQRLPAAPFTKARDLTIQTVQLMFEDFRAFGPDEEEFPRDAIYHALAAILKAFGVRSIQGRSFTAAGIKRLLARHPPPPYMG